MFKFARADSVEENFMSEVSKSFRRPWSIAVALTGRRGANYVNMHAPPAESYKVEGNACYLHKCRGQRGNFTE
jgi:hypothetical protein